MTEARLRLSDDHHAVSEVLTQLLTAFDNKDVQTSYSKLDLLWARLAVHIRAEHLHLFPAMLNRLTESLDGVVPDLSEAQAIVESLRADHDFFMRRLAWAIAKLRALPKNVIRPGDEPELAAVRDTILEVETRLTTHNEIEENEIYRWSSAMLTKTEQSELLVRINAELENRPARFSKEAWANFPYSSRDWKLQTAVPQKSVFYVTSGQFHHPVAGGFVRSI